MQTLGLLPRRCFTYLLENGARLYPVKKQDVVAGRS